MISATQLYNYLTCAHRVTMDAFGNVADREPPNAFIEMLWERGSLYEREVIGKLNEPFTDLSAFPVEEKERATREAIARGDPLIYAGRLTHGQLLGEPDLLRREKYSPEGRPLYIAVDIKSGSGEEGIGDEDGGDGKPKRTYGVQLGLYTDILIREGISAGRYAYVWDIHGDMVRYEFDSPLGPRTPESLWVIYTKALEEASAAVESNGKTKPALAATCKLCVWRMACLRLMKQSGDLTLLPELGRARRESLGAEFSNVEELARANIEKYLSGRKTTFPGVGPETLRKFHARAKLAIDQHSTPYLKKKIDFPESAQELYFDIETDPLRNFCYLHGFVVRNGRDNASEVFVPFFADRTTPEAEERAFSDAWTFIARHTDATVYTYSKYERTIYRQLAARYPKVCSAEEVESLFAPSRTVDLYFDVVRPHTEWPTLDFSIKSVAKSLGFEWHDSHPSGAASIQWFDQYTKTQSIKDKQRILDYNEDDCRAMRVLKDALLEMRIFAE